MALVSVIIPTFNRAHLVQRAVASVLDQTFPDYEIIVVDDGSADDTERLVVSRFGPLVRYIRHSTNKGVSAARNTGIRASDSQLIAFLDSDDHWLPEKLAAQLAFLKANRDIPACQTEEIWMRNGRRILPRKRHQKPSGDIFERSLKLCLVSPSAVMLKRSLLDEVGLFDESLPACEDYDLWLRIGCRYPVGLIREDLVIKEGGSPDQLSVRFKGMDRFRIISLLKLIKSGVLDERQLGAALEELTLKCRIYGNGCLKRGRVNEGLFYLDLPGRAKKGVFPHSYSLL